MSYTFKKTIDPTNKFDNTDVTVELPHNEQTLDDLCQAFSDFLKGCGFIIDGEIIYQEREEDPPEKYEPSGVSIYTEDVDDTGADTDGHN